MTALLYHLGRFCVRFRWIVIIFWLVVVVGLGAWAKSAGNQAADSLSLPGTGSQQAADVLNERFPSQSQGSSPIVVHSADKGLLTSPSNRSAIAAAVAAAKKAPQVAQVQNPLEAPPGSGSVSPNSKTALINVSLKNAITNYSVVEVIDLVDSIEAPLSKAGLESAAGGQIGLKATKPATDTSAGIGIIAALIILLFTFGSAVSMLLPIITAMLGVGTAISTITLLSHVVDVPSAVPALATMIGLGVGIDYSLFVLSRHREQIAGGMAIEESIARSVATSGAAVLFAGGTVVIALCSLAIAGIPIVASMGYLSAIAVLVAIVAALTLLPAIMAALGPKVDSLKLPFLHNRAAQEADHDHGGWARWARGIARRPWPPMIAAIAILLVLAIPTLSLQLGQPDTAAGAKSLDSTRAYDLIASGFGEGVNGPVLVAVKLPQKPTDAADLAKLDKAIAADPDVASVSPPLENAKQNAATITVIPKSSPPSDATVNLVNRLRSEVIPKTLGSSDVEAYVGGSTAAYIDIANEIQDKLPISILIVVALSFFLLLLAFRSILIPLQAAVMNLLGVAASYGMLVAVFQWGWATELIGLSGSVPIVSFVPLMMFAILFGLSMDYEVFLVTHIQEEYEEGADNNTAVVRGL
ncbi:MAG: MMPL family transporter, partial [Actinobacteria bacterium]|nr:MMPL family transporter [Actinomycetota bacterium]